MSVVTSWTLLTTSPIHRRDCGHRDRPAFPVRAAIETMPDVLGVLRVASDERRDHVRFEIGDDRLLAPVERRVAEPIDPWSVKTFNVTKFRPGLQTMTFAPVIFTSRSSRTRSKSGRARKTNDPLEPPGASGGTSRSSCVGPTLHPTLSHLRRGAAEMSVPAWKKRVMLKASG